MSWLGSLANKVLKNPILNPAGAIVDAVGSSVAKNKTVQNAVDQVSSGVSDIFDWGKQAAESMSGITANEIATQNLEYQREYNQQIFDREDTAYQRLVEDLTAAGLNPAFGVEKSSGAGAGGSTSAPHMTYRNEDITKPLNAILNIRKLFGDLDEQEAKVNSINVGAKALADKTASDIAFNEGMLKKMGIESDYFKSQMDYYNVRTENERKRIDTEIEVAKSVAKMNNSQAAKVDAETQYLVDSAADRLKKAKADAQSSYTNAFYLGTAMTLENKLKQANLDKVLSDTDLLIQKFDHLSTEHQLDVLSRYYDLLYAAHNNVSIGTNPTDKSGATIGAGLTGLGNFNFGTDSSRTGGKSVHFDDVIRNFGLNTF